MSKRKKDDVFIEITNEQIFNKLHEMDTTLQQCLIEVKTTNGKVKAHKTWLIALSGVLVIIFFTSVAPQLIPHILKLLMLLV